VTRVRVCFGTRQKTRAEVQSDTLVALQSTRAAFYCKYSTDSSVAAQRQELGSGFEYVKLVQCDNTPEDCKGVNAPAWKIGDKVHEGVKTLEQLRELTKAATKKPLF
jgi:hypothetical protein